MLMTRSLLTDRPTWTLSLEEGRPELTISGAVCAPNLEGMAEELERLCDEVDQCVCLNLEQVDFIDIPALQLLARSACVFRQRKRRLRLKNLNPPLRTKLDRFHLLDIFCHERICQRNCDQSKSAQLDGQMEVDVFTLPMELAFSREARQRIDTIAERLGYCRTDRNDIVLAVGEAATNAIKYGAEADAGDSFTVSCVADAERLCLSISDNGPGFCLESLPECEDYLFVDHGRGIFFMRSVMDSVAFDFDSGTTVRMVKLATKSDQERLEVSRPSQWAGIAI